MSIPNGHTEHIRRAAVSYLRAGLAVIPVPAGEKNPNRKDWQGERWGVKDVPRLWTNGQGIGALWGGPSGGLVDLDCDWPEARAIARHIAPKTRTFGREGAPASHHVVRVVGGKPPKSKRYKLPGKGEDRCVVEILSTGAHSLVPPSLHGGSGEERRWYDERQAATLAPSEMVSVADDVAAGALLLRHYPGPGARHDYANAATGYLGRHLERERAERIMRAVVAESGDEEREDRLRAVAATLDNLGAGKPATGGPSLDALAGGVPERIARWYGWRGGEDRGQDRGGDGSAGRDKPLIVTTDRDTEELLEETRRALAAANDPPELFHRDRGLAAVVRDENGLPVIHAVGKDGLRERMARAATFAKATKGGPHRVMPPEALAGMLLGRGGGWDGIPPLEKLSGVPVLRPDGEIHDRRGYERATRTYYDPGEGAAPSPVPRRPTPAQADEALETLREPFRDFPFVSEADEANTLGLLLTPIARPAIAGPVPLALIDKPVMGSGASLIAEVVATVATGQAEMRGQCATPEEWAKSITAALLGGAPVIVFDNIGERLDTHVLARALTADIWTERVLGQSREASIPQRATWIATGKNVQLGGDIPRRCYRIRLDPKTAQPWRRGGFRHPELLGFVRENRPRIVSAGLTLCRAWFVAGCPDGTGGRQPFGKFEAWERVISGVLANAGVSGFLANLDQFYEEADEDAGEWEDFLAAWHAALGSSSRTLSQLHEFMETVAGRPVAGSLPEDLSVAFKDARVRPDGREGFVRRLGYALRERKDRRYGAAGYHATTEEQSAKSRKSKKWRVLLG